MLSAPTNKSRSVCMQQLWSILNRRKCSRRDTKKSCPSRDLLWKRVVGWWGNSDEKVYGRYCGEEARGMQLWEHWREWRKRCTNGIRQSTQRLQKGATLRSSCDLYLKVVEEAFRVLLLQYQRISDVLGSISCKGRNCPEESGITASYWKTTSTRTREWNTAQLE